MAGYSRGGATHLQDKFPKALYTDCLNLYVVKCYSIREISNVMGILQTVLLGILNYLKYIFSP